MWFVGIDPSLTQTGIALLPEGIEGAKPEFRLIKPPSKYNKAGSLARLDYIRQEMDVFCFYARGLGEVALTGIEKPVWRSTRSGPQHGMGEGSGFIRMAVWRHLGPQVRVLPHVWKAELLTGKERSKEASVKEALHYLDTVWGITDLNPSEDEAEALLIARYAQRYHHKQLQNDPGDGLEYHPGKIYAQGE